MATDVLQTTKQDATSKSLSTEDQRQLYYFLIKTRLFDERCRRLFKQGRFPGTYFSAVGQEAAGVGSAFSLRREDVIAPSHRELGAYVTKGIPLVHFLKQIFARANSSDKGKSHPCHYGSTEHGLYTPASTMAGQLPVGVGMALAFKIRKEPRVCMAFIGEGGTSRGGFHEALNFAGIHDLPIVFVCMNNLWAESVPAKLQSRIERYSDRAKAYGFPGVTIDGNDLLLVNSTVKSAIDKARSGGGPTLIECLTYRWYGHSEIDPATYRDPAEVEYWKKRDPVLLYEKHLDKAGVMSAVERETMKQEIETEMEQAISIAESSPHPQAEEAYDDVYSFSPNPNFPG